MTLYLQQLPSNPLVKIQEYRPKPNQYTLAEGIEGEEAVWLYIQDVQQVDGSYKAKAFVDEALKALILQERLDAELAEQASKNEKNALKDAVKALKTKKISSMNDIEDAIKKIVAMLEAYL